MKDYIKITSGMLPRGSAKFVTQDGREIGGVAACDIRMRVGEICSAKINFNLGMIDIEAESLLSFDNVCAAARHYGYDLIPIQEVKD